MIILSITGTPEGGDQKNDNDQSSLGVTTPNDSNTNSSTASAVEPTTIIGGIQGAFVRCI
jgi:hypothetical protein